MSEISAIFRGRWRSAKHVGPAKPEMRVEIRRGRFEREFSPHYMLDGSFPKFGYFQKTPQGTPWHAYWVADSDWVDLPGVQECTLDQDFDNNGIHRCSLTVENLRYKQQSGLAGIYHAIERGFLSPFRGFKPKNRPAIANDQNEWYDMLAQNAQIRVWQGYGDDEMVPVFTGLLDDADPEAGGAARITVVARDFGQLLTDQRFMGWVKDRTVKDPVTFADRRYADETKLVGGAAKASSSRAGDPPSHVVDTDAATGWFSDGHNGPDFTEWVQIRLPRGRYEDFTMHPAYEGLSAYVSVYARGNSKRIDAQGTKHSVSGWVDLGNGDVPGGNGGIPYLRYISSVAGRRRSYRLQQIYELGDDSVLRISFRNLQKGRAGKRYAGVRRLAALKRKVSSEAKQNRWILVDDASDIVKIILRWCGFQEWAVESTGVRLSDKLVFNRSDFLIDAIKKISELTNYQFYMGDPSGDEDSRGVPTFRLGSPFTDPGYVETVRDTDLLTGIKVHITDEPLVTVIRVRGKLASSAEGGRRDFVGSGADTMSAYNCFYRPPWARGVTGQTGNQPAHSGGGRTGGVIKHIVHIDPMLSSQKEVDVAARMIAAAECLKAATSIIEIPANPGFELDGQVFLLDTGTGMATRLWIAQRQSTFRTGEQASWTMSLGGSLLDTPDLTQVLAELRAVESEVYDEAGEEAPIPLTGAPQGPIAPRAA